MDMSQRHTQYDAVSIVIGSGDTISSWFFYSVSLMANRRQSLIEKREIRKDVSQSSLRDLVEILMKITYSMSMENHLVAKDVMFVNEAYV